MAALTDLSDLVNRMTGGNSGTPETIFWHKRWHISGTATAWADGNWWSLWTWDGHPGAGAAPGQNGTGQAYIPDNTTNGGLKQTDPGGGREKWLVQTTAMCGGDAGILLLYDRLSHLSGLDGTVATAQPGTANTAALTRYTDGVGNMIMVEIYTAVGSTARTLTASYTDQDNNSGQTSASVTFGGTSDSAAGRAFLVPLASGDTGVRQIASVTISATTGTAGDFGFTIIHPLAWMPVHTGANPGWRDFATGMPGLPEIQTDACLAFAMLTNGTSEGPSFGAVSFVEA